LAKETYKQHDNDAKSVRMWVKDNADKIFYFQETSHEPTGKLSTQNIPFTISIEMPWQKEMMLTHGHEKGVAIDATFGTNENKVHPLTFMSNLVELDHLLFKFSVPRYVIVQLWNIHIELGSICNHNKHFGAQLQFPLYVHDGI
jgi:hypothetical protein